jgi:nitrate reductase delta subunit
VRAFLDHLESTPLPELQADYVETFDTRRRCNLFLTYFAHGDTRKRGMALLRFKQTYLRAGFELDDAELPDHLCVVLEFAATVDQGWAGPDARPPRRTRSCCGLSLRDLAPVGHLSTRSRPPAAAAGDERDAVRRLAAEGPPEEEVGRLRRHPQFSPAPPSRRARTTLLPMPSFPGATLVNDVPLRGRPLHLP